MIFKIIINYILGYVNISAEGYYIERFINICISKGILLWNVKREKSTFMFANVGKNDFKALKEISKKTKCRIKINEKRGLPFLMNRYRKRKIFFIVFVLVIILMYVASKFIWNIEILGTETIDRQEMLNELAENGLKEGMLKSRIDAQKIINQIRLDRDDIAWMNIDLNGTNVIVKVVETTKKPEILDESEYCNIVSTKTAQITKITAKTGTILVKIGDIVTEDSILIGGWMEGKYTGTRYVHASGEVQGKVWYTKSEKINLKQIKQVRTGVSKKRYNIKFNNFQINLYKSIPNFEKYDTINEEKKIRIFSNFYLPISLGISTYYETVDQEINLSQEEAKQYLTDKLKDEVLEEIENHDDIQDVKVNTANDENSVEVEVIYEVLENIGTQEKILN